MIRERERVDAISGGIARLSAIKNSITEAAGDIR